MRHCGQLHRGGRGHIPSSGCLHGRHLLEAARGFRVVSVSGYAAGHFTVFSIFKLHFLSGFFLLSSCSRSREGQNQLAGSQLQFWTVPLALRAFLSSLQGPQIVCVTQQWAQTMQRRRLCTSLLVSPGFSPRFLYLILCV